MSKSGVFAKWGKQIWTKARDETTHSLEHALQNKTYTHKARKRRQTESFIIFANIIIFYINVCTRQDTQNLSECEDTRILSISYIICVLFDCNFLLKGLCVICSIVRASGAAQVCITCIQTSEPAFTLFVQLLVSVPRETRTIYIYPNRHTHFIWTSSYTPKWKPHTHTPDKNRYTYNHDHRYIHSYIYS